MKQIKKIFILILILAALLFNILSPRSVQAQSNPIQSAKDTLLYLFQLISNSSGTDQPPVHSQNPNGTSTPYPGQFGAPNVTIGPIPPPNASKLTKILYWANVLNQRLIAVNHIWPPWWYFHKMVNPVSNGGYTGIAASATSTSNIYWCTYLVIDAFNLSGLRGLTTAHSAVLNMIPFFMNTPGYTFIPYSVAFSTYSPPRYRVTTNAERRQSLAKVQPGCTTFFQSNPGVHERNHVAILKTKVLNANFDGYIETYDSNNTVRIVRYPIRAGNIENTLYVPDSLRGFGCPI